MPPTQKWSFCLGKLQHFPGALVLDTSWQSWNCECWAGVTGAEHAGRDQMKAKCTQLNCACHDCMGCSDILLEHNLCSCKSTVWHSIPSDEDHTIVCENPNPPPVQAPVAKANEWNIRHAPSNMVTNLLRGINHPREKIVLLLLFEEGSRGFREAISSVNLKGVRTMMSVMLHSTEYFA